MVTIRLLGPPAIERDGQVLRPPRGRKAWALLAYLLLADRSPSRRHLAELLFADAEDPLGALRWTLAELRRALGAPGVLGGDPVSTDFGPDLIVDVVLAMQEGADLLAARGELLEGLELPSSLEFESWLLVERHRVSSRIEARLHQKAVALLAAGRAGEAVTYASRAVAYNPLEEGHHELLVRSLALTGDRPAALKQVAVCQDLLRVEVGIEASLALTEAASALAVRTPTGVSTGSDRSGTSKLHMPGPLASGRGSAVGQLEAGRAAIAAGAADAGVECLRRAVSEAARCQDVALQARALAALGGALVHSVRGRDEEGALVLHEAIDLATSAGDDGVLVTAYRLLGFVEVQAGRRRTADSWLAKAQAVARTDAELAAVQGVRGMNASDRADYPAAFRHLEDSVDRAAAAGDSRQQSWSLSILGRAHLLRGERSQAAVALDRSIELAHEQRWIAFLPWPQTLRAEIDLYDGRLDAAADQLEQAWVMACQLGDPCWEGMVARALGLFSTLRADHPAAVEWFAEAATRSNRGPDRYQWIHAHVLDTMIATALDRGEPDRAAPLVTRLGALAARCDMRELVVRAHLHRHRLGDQPALRAARLLAVDIDNPVITQLLER
ncbi:AfsR/SARP family transcriptional regulator [Kribbella deserti]|uniref:BTAD domain-containing putative transcriptional regulator n=1 Tax=Kribbella deserti TaxID=1926257 RepID=A0ABV6QI41_9ACTN